MTGPASAQEYDVLDGLHRPCKAGCHLKATPSGNRDGSDRARALLMAIVKQCQCLQGSMERQARPLLSRR